VYALRVRGVLVCWVAFLRLYCVSFGWETTLLLNIKFSLIGDLISDLLSDNLTLNEFLLTGYCYDNDWFIIAIHALIRQ